MLREVEDTMTELKTLKDLNEKYDDQDNCGYSWNMGDVRDELTKFATEWVVKLKKECVCNYLDHWCEHCHKSDWIKMFFSISDEDLKQ